MWLFIIHSPEKEPVQIELKPGVTTLGRAPANDIVIDDVSASRQHAKIIFDSTANTITLMDLDSTNGTYVNHQRVIGSNRLQHDDLVRIGQVMMHLTHYTGEIAAHPTARETHRFTRELLLESLDEHSIIISDIARRLNTIFELEAASDEIIRLLKNTMGVDDCEIILAGQLEKMVATNFIDPLAKQAIGKCSAEITPTTMFVPIMNDEKLAGLISMKKSRTGTRPFGRRDLHLAIAISYQISLTIQRIDLLEKVRREEQARRLLMRFVSPTETDFLLKEYFQNGELPGLKEEKITVMFADIADSTGLAEHLGPEHFGRILNNFYSETTQLIFKHHGMVKYLGDGILAIFPEQMDGISPEEKAVVAAQEMLNAFNSPSFLDPEQRIIVGIAINTGMAMVGYVGTQERAEFNVLGDVVNVAYRMQELARPYKIIVGPATVAAINTKYRFRRIGAVSLRGREQAIQIYEVFPETNFVT